MRKIYVASSWRNPIQGHVVERLRAAGHQVYDFKNPPGRAGFSWREVDPDWEKWTPEAYLKGLKSPEAQAGFRADADAMEWADTCVLVLPCGRSAHLEAGWMSGQKKRLVILLDDLSIPTLGHTMVDTLSGEPMDRCPTCHCILCKEPDRRRALREPELMYKFADLITPSLSEALAFLATTFAEAFETREQALNEAADIIASAIIKKVRAHKDGEF